MDFPDLFPMGQKTQIAPATKQVNGNRGKDQAGNDNGQQIKYQYLINSEKLQIINLEIFWPVQWTANWATDQKWTIEISDKQFLRFDV